MRPQGRDGHELLLDLHRLRDDLVDALLGELAGEQGVGDQGKLLEHGVVLTTDPVLEMEYRSVVDEAKVQCQ